MSDTDFSNRKLFKTEAGESGKFVRMRLLEKELFDLRNNESYKAPGDKHSLMLRLLCRLEYQRKHQEALRHNETEAESAERLEYKRGNQEALRQTEIENERMVRLKSRTVLYVASKTLQSKRYLNLARSQISAEVSDGLVEQHSI